MPTKPEGPAQDQCPHCGLFGIHAMSCQYAQFAATPAPAAHTEPHGAFFQPHVIPKVKGCPDCEAMAKRVTVLGQTRPENVGLTPLMEMCDREWSDETPEQVIAIAANAIYWRNREIQKLREHSAPSQPAGARELLQQMSFLWQSKDDSWFKRNEERIVLFAEEYAHQQTAAKDAEIAEWRRDTDSFRVERDQWRLRAETEHSENERLRQNWRIKAQQHKEELEVAERERDSLRAENAALKARLVVADDMEAHDDR